MTLAWAYEDEHDAFAERVRHRVENEGAHVPAVWPLEVMNALLNGERRGRITATLTLSFVEMLDSLEIEIEPGNLLRAAGSVRALAQIHGLSVYDASYLELCLREGLPLATLDQRLRQAAQAERIELTG